MKRIIICFLILSIFVSGCAHTISKYSNETRNEFYSRAEKICEKKDDLIIETVDGDNYKVRELRITEDTTSFIENSSNLFVVKKTTEIKWVSFYEALRGATEGLIYGSLICGGAGVLGQLNTSGGSPKVDYAVPQKIDKEIG
jgi:hypothetical protein